MRRTTVSIDDIAPAIALTVHQRRLLVVLGNALAAKETFTLHGQTTMTRGFRALERKGYVKWNPETRFQMTALGALRYAAELSHLRHCKGCALCDAVR